MGGARRGGCVGESERWVGVVDEGDGGDAHEGAAAALNLFGHEKCEYLALSIARPRPHPSKRKAFSTGVNFSLKSTSL